MKENKKLEELVENRFLPSFDYMIFHHLCQHKNQIHTEQVDRRNERISWLQKMLNSFFQLVAQPWNYRLEWIDMVYFIENLAMKCRENKEFKSITW